MKIHHCDEIHPLSWKKTSLHWKFINQCDVNSLLYWTLFIAMVTLKLDDISSFDENWLVWCRFIVVRKIFQGKNSLKIISVTNINLGKVITVMVYIMEIKIHHIDKYSSAVKKYYFDDIYSLWWKFIIVMHLNELRLTKTQTDENSSDSGKFFAV